MPPLLEPEPRQEDQESPVERAALREQLDQVEAEKRQALLEPGPSWREWWYFSASKWYVGLGLLIIDSWVLGTWFELGSWTGATLSLIAAVYLEFLLYQYLYYRPHPDAERRRGRERLVWVHPVDFGRWTPEGQILRSGGRIPGVSDSPTAEEFL
ncbi:MAG: hypothetical protein ABSB97_05550 [Thermoplasmata archaeon]|jgi:hypothetical protein